VTDHTALAAREQAYVAFPYEDVYCKRCGARLGAFIGAVPCPTPGCKLMAVVLTPTERRT
jgi:hypothetical protein